MQESAAQKLFGNQFVGSEALSLLSAPFAFGSVRAPEIPFPEDVLKALVESHLLIFAPSDSHVSIDWFREQFGVNPEKEPCMYNQDWYVTEDFAGATLDGKWHLIPKMVREDARAAPPESIEQTLAHEQFASAITYTFVFFVWHMLRGEILWKHDFVWCSDRDHNGDRIYVGRYEDPTGVNKNGFNIHRHLALRSNYAAAPEITS